MSKYKAMGGGSSAPSKPYDPNSPVKRRAYDAQVQLETDLGLQPRKNIADRLRTGDATLSSAITGDTLPTTLLGS